ncbi:ABC transporter permease subunit [Bradyrhizobium cajani]|uniref:ABC transporter permease subunit n=1 Tax=Bradyrhizobium cajani TaxID=1928661 RepID=A0A844TIW6_9BRAD|nr:ABC transporter permease subunit [Bradyrhizobium cajani]
MVDASLAMPHRRDTSGWAQLVPVLLLLPIVILFSVGYVVPLAQLVLKSLQHDGAWSLNSYIEIANSPAFLWIVLRTIALAATVTIVCLLIAYPLAYAISKCSPRAASLLLLIVTLPYLTSVLIRTYAWIVLLSPNGPINQLFLRLGLISEPLQMVFNSVGVYVGMVQVQLPLMVFPLYAVLARVDPSLAKAAQSLGSPPTDAFLRVTLPAAIPGVISGCTLVFLSSLGFYITPELLGGPDSYLIAQGISLRVLILGNFDEAAAQSTILMLTVIAVFLIFRQRIAEELDDRPHDNVSPSGKSSSGLSARWPILERLTAVLHGPSMRLHEALTVVRRPALYVSAGLTLLLLVLPFVVVIPLAFSNAPYLTFPPPAYSLRWFSSLLKNTQWLDALSFSLRWAGLSALLSVAIGVPAAFALVRYRFSARVPVYLLLISPLIVPHVVIAVSLFFALAGSSLIGNPLAFALSYTIIGAPYTVVVMIAGLKRFNRTLELAAASLGSSPLVTLRTVTLPLLLPTLASAALFAFIVGFDDVVFGLFLSGPTATPLPMRMWDNIRLEISPQIAVIAVLFLIVLALLMLLRLFVGAVVQGRRPQQSLHP